MRKWINLFEAPISVTYSEFDRNQGSFRDDDKRLATNAKARTKITHLWRNSVVDVDAILVNARMSPSQAASPEEDNSIIPASWVSDMLDMEDDFVPRADAITVVFTHNEGAARVPMTGWILAHRLYHIFEIASSPGYRSKARYPEINRIVKGLDVEVDSFYKDMYELYKDGRHFKWHQSRDSWYYFEEFKHDLVEAILPTKAARNQNLTSSMEFDAEAFALYILRGKLKLNSAPDQFSSGPNRKIKGIYTLGKHEREEADQLIANIEQVMVAGFRELIEFAKGQVFML